MENTGRIIDLHTHTLCSDGSMTPAELIRHAKESGLSENKIAESLNNCTYSKLS